MKNARLCIMFMSVLGGLGFSAETHDEWLQRTLVKISDLERNSDKFEMIRGIEDYLSLHQSPSLTDQQKIVFERVKADVVSVPGYAEFYRERFYMARADLLAGKIEQDSYLYAQQSISFLAALPTPETVSVLGELLGDSEGRNGKSIQGFPRVSEHGVHPSVAIVAADTLDRIGIDHPPVKNMGGFERADAWNEWWDQVKRGKRTYRFSGSPIEYGPKGQVAAIEDAGSRTRSRRATEIRPDIESANQGQASSGKWLYGIASTVLAGLGWLWWRMARRGAAGRIR